MSNAECFANDEARSSKASGRRLAAERRIFVVPSFVIRHWIRVTLTLTLITLSSALAWLAVEPPLERHEFREPHMGTEFKIILYTPDEPSANAASRAAFDRIAQLDAMLSDYRADSELMQLCAKAGRPPVRVSDELFFVLSRSQDLARRTDGEFDVTVGPVVRLWRRARRQKQLPDPARLAAARELVGHAKLKLDERDQTVGLQTAGMQLDLGGIAKGYAADEAMAVLKRYGVARALVAASGDIVVSAPPPGESGWTIGIAPPEGATKPPRDFLLLHDAAVSTSGDTEQFLELAGRRYSHIINPKSGEALTDRLQVTVVAATGTASDSLATAASVLGPDRGLPLIESLAAAVQIIRPSEQGPVVLESTRFKELPRGQARQK